MQISIFGACSEVTASGVGMSTEAETASVCSIHEQLMRVEFLGKWSEQFRAYAL